MFNLGFGQTVLAVVFGLGALIAIGYLTDVSDEEKKKQQQGGGGGKVKIPQTQEEFARLSPEEQQKVIEEIRNQQGGGGGAPGKTSPQETQIHKLLEAAEGAKTRGDYDRAEQCYTQAIALLEREPSYGGDHYYVGLSSYALALVYKTNNQPEKSVPVMKKAIAILEKNISSQPEIADQVADALATLADVFITLKRFDEAELPLQRSIAIVTAKNEIIRNFKPANTEQQKEREQELKKIQQELGILLDTLTKLRFEQQRFIDAEDIGKKAIQIMSAAFGNDKTAEPLIHRARMRLGEILIKLDKEEGGREVFDTLIQEKEKDGPESVVANYCRVFARTCKENGNFSLAASYLTKAVPILEKSDSKFTQGDLVESLCDLASFYRALNKIEKANEIQSTLLQKLQEKNLPAPVPFSQHIRITKAGVEFATDPNNKHFVAPFFSLSLTNLKLSPGEVLVFTFPASNDTTAQAEVAVTDQKEITQTSPQLDKVEEKYYTIKVTIYSDSSKQTELSTVPVIVKSNIDSSTITDSDHLQEKLYETK